jgi:crotonobetainyl-CoA:carnitine CoA-transferase CaiB-like acyl-CoA transferase
VRAADGWLAVNLARPSDAELLPAWLESDEPWEAVVGRRSAAALDERAALLGLPVGLLGSVPPKPLLRRPARPQPRARRGFLVVDLSALWAGPLCSWLLAMAGAEVVAFETPDRRSNRQYEAERTVVGSLDGLELRDLLERADVVIEGSRPRALEQAGIDRETTGAVWVSITARGVDAPNRNRPGFGDDCAVAGGLVLDGPAFCGDAIADPITGTLAAVSVLLARQTGGPFIVDAGLAPCAAALARAA